MSKTRKTYDREFKMMAVELSKKRTELVSLAKELDVRPELLYRWRKEFSLQQEFSFPGNGKVLQSDLEAENAKLKRQLNDSEMENAILKKAVSIFSRSDGKSSNS
jgi:transposase